MDAPVILWGLTLAAAGIVLLQLWWLQQRIVNIEAATSVLLKILMAGNRERAIKLTNAAPQAVYMRAVRRALEGESQTRDAVKSRFDDALADGLRSFAPIQNAGYAAILLAGLGVGLAVTPSTPVMSVAVAGAAVVLVAMLNLTKVGKVAEDSRAGFARLLDVIVAAPAASLSSSDPAEPVRAPSSPHSLVLVATVDGREIARRALDTNIVKIGKIPSCHMPIDHESISRMHAVVEVTDGEAQIIDLGSSAGTKHNGNSVNKATLAAGDVLQLGDVRIDVIAAAAAVG
jgi:hypothetical protein